MCAIWQSSVHGTCKQCAPPGKVLFTVHVSNVRHLAKFCSLYMQVMRATWQNSCRLCWVSCWLMRWVFTDLSKDSNTRLPLQGQAIAAWRWRRKHCHPCRSNEAPLQHKNATTQLSHILTFWCRNYFFLILAHPVYKMWIIQDPNKLELWNKPNFEEEKKRRVYTMCKIFSTYICWINIYIF
jgi:hypothetical protein